MNLPVCWCGDPGTYALDALHPAGVGTTEARWVWTYAGSDHLIVTRCRAHAGVFSAEITDGPLVPVQPVPIDDTPYVLRPPSEDCCGCVDRWQPCGCRCHT